MFRIEQDVSDRFYKRVKKSPNGCWEWTGELTINGYGRFQVNNKGKKTRHSAHRVAFFLENGPFPKEKIICHSCDNRICVNPDHLWIGTCQENTDDMFRKGRQNIYFGNKHGRSKITDEQFLKIVSEFERGKDAKYISMKYRISIDYATQIRSGQSERYKRLVLGNGSNQPSHGAGNMKGEVR